MTEWGTGEWVIAGVAFVPMVVLVVQRLGAVRGMGCPPLPQETAHTERAVTFMTKLGVGRYSPTEVPSTPNL